MGHLRGGARLLPEALLLRGVGVEPADHLEGHDALQAGVLGLVHHAHAAFAHFGQDAVRTDALGNLRHGRRLRLRWQLG